MQRRNGPSFFLGALDVLPPQAIAITRGPSGRTRCSPRCSRSRGQWREISVMMTYLFQGWNCRGPQKYKDMILDIGTEEIGHLEMLAAMIGRLLETSPVEQQEDMPKNSLLGAVMGGARIEDAIVAGMNPQHVVVSGLGATPTDSVGFPWTSRYMIASGNLLPDFRFNVTAESQGRLQVSRSRTTRVCGTCCHFLLPAIRCIRTSGSPPSR
jgi:hypothetical protein